MFEHIPTSYWQETISPIPFSTDIPQRADIVVIGGGILGTAICYWLARAGVSVVLLERAQLAHGATGRNGGYVSIAPAGSYTQAIARLGHETVQSVLKVTLQNKAILRQVLAEEKIACSYHEPGSVHVALSQEQWRSLAQETIALQADGIRVEMLDRNQVQEPQTGEYWQQRSDGIIVLEPV